jgi:hypothetical protein
MYKKQLQLLKIYYGYGGYTKAIGNYLNLTREELNTIIKQNSFKRKKKSKKSFVKLLPKLRDFVRYLYEKELLTYKKIGELFGVSTYTIQSISYEDGWKSRGTKYAQYAKHGIGEDEVIELIKLYEQGAKQIDLALNYSCERSLIRQILDSHCIERRPIKNLFTKEEKKRIKHLYVEKGFGAEKIRKDFMGRRYGVKRILKSMDDVHLRSLSEQNRFNATQITKNNSSYTTLVYKEFIKDSRSLTNHIYKMWKYVIDTEKRGRNNIWHLDHVYSLYDCFYGEELVTIWEVCHPFNLKLVTINENLSKRAKSYLTTKELRKGIEAWNEEWSDPFYYKHDDNYPFFNYITEKYGDYEYV